MPDLGGALAAFGLVGVLAWFVLPIASVAIDTLPALKAGRRRVSDIDQSTPWCDDFELLVPIYGSLRYLENVEFLRAYGSRVVLCTTTAEDADFLLGLRRLAAAHGFRVFTTHVPGRGDPNAGRSVSAPIRDRLVRDALATVTAPYVVCIDADTVTARPLQHLVGAFVEHGLDLASVRLLPSNRDTLLARLQGHEYRTAMRMRRLYPWLVSGACHVARTPVHFQVMQRHSMFFQGNDVELGMIAEAMGFTVGHIPFDVPTTVPSRWRPWLRQRYAWAGGEFRIFFVNARFALRHRYFYLYGAVVLTLLCPWRWMTVIDHPWVLAAVYLAYLFAFATLHWRTRDWTLLVLPLYTLIITLVLVPLSVVSYAVMAAAHRNSGRIRSAGGIRWGTDSVRITGAICVAGVSVADLQRALTAVGHDVGPIDNRFGPRTRRALIDWQRELIELGHDLGPMGADGVFGPATATASQQQALWRGVDDASITTDEWLQWFERCRAFDPGRARRSNPLPIRVRAAAAVAS